ncbi:hypothetical protein [Kistimonas asteriae]|uniref:hypothetical protein n=1 Tax=Kistimonas asteriae TaxID=517724 RepID=UPI001BAA2B10|nr:hypothetical protein [Kistimonas asteriae]
MTTNLFHELKRLGIDEELAYQLDKSLAPEYNATKQDLLVMQETLLQMQFRTEAAITGLREEVRKDMHSMQEEIQETRGDIQEIRGELKDVRGEIKDVRGEIKLVEAGLKLDLAGFSRQFWITFGGLIVTILSVWGVNWYFHTLG